MQAATGRKTEAGILARLFQEREEGVTPEVAGYLLSLRFDSEDIERMNWLSDRAHLGALTPDEAAELDCYIHVGNLLATVQAKAKTSLHAHGRAGA